MTDSTDGSALDDRVRVVLRPVGSGLPLGFFSFGVGMAMIGGADVGVVPPSTVHEVGWLLLTFVAPLELLAAVIAFLARDSVAGTGLGLFAGSWATIGVQQVMAHPGSTSPVLGLYLFAFTTAVVLLGVVARKGQPLIAMILLAASVRGYLAGLYEFTGSGLLLVSAGVVGLAITAAAFYGGLAYLLEDSAHRTTLPLGRRGDARTALGGTFSEQISGIESEAGVRRTL